MTLFGDGQIRCKFDVIIQVSSQLHPHTKASTHVIHLSHLIYIQSPLFTLFTGNFSFIHVSHLHSDVLVTWLNWDLCSSSNNFHSNNRDSKIVSLLIPLKTFVLLKISVLLWKITWTTHRNVTVKFVKATLVEPIMFVFIIKPIKTLIYQQISMKMRGYMFVVGTKRVCIMLVVNDPIFWL